MAPGRPHLHLTVEQQRAAQQRSQAWYRALHADERNARRRREHRGRPGGNISHSSLSGIPVRVQADVLEVAKVAEDHKYDWERRLQIAHQALSRIQAIAAQLRLMMSLPLADWLDNVCRAMKSDDDPGEVLREAEKMFVASYTPVLQAEARLTRADEHGPIWHAARPAYTFLLDARRYLGDIRECLVSQWGTFASSHRHQEFKYQCELFIIQRNYSVCRSCRMDHPNQLPVPSDMKLQLADFPYDDNQKALLEHVCVPYVDCCDEAVETGCCAHADYVFDGFAAEWFANYPVEGSTVEERFVAEEEKKEELRTALVAAYAERRAALGPQEPSQRDNSAWDAYVTMYVTTLQHPGEDRDKDDNMCASEDSSYEDGSSTLSDSSSGGSVEATAAVSAGPFHLGLGMWAAEVLEALDEDTATGYWELANMGRSSPVPHGAFWAWEAAAENHLLQWLDEVWEKEEA
ncbi:hypothetical protein EV421DRAFT_1739210, partial [Armillaria borealis]